MSDFLELILPWRENTNDEISDFFVYGILFIFVILLVIFLLKAIRRTHSIGSLVKEVDNLGTKYDRPADPVILNDLEKVFEDEDKLFKKAWQEFKESLVIPERRKVVYKTDESSLFFSEDRLLGQYLNLRFWNSVPALLVGLGILGTFVGLVWGLIPFSGINFERTEEIRKGIEKLLSGVSTAFVTSVWGMLVSLLFNGVEKLYIGKISREIAILQDVLDVPFTLKTEEEIAEKQKDELEQQTAALIVKPENICTPAGRCGLQPHRVLCKSNYGIYYKSFSTDLANDIIVKSENICTPAGRCGLQPHRVLCKSNYGIYYKSAMDNIMSKKLDNLDQGLTQLHDQNARSSQEIVQELPNGGRTRVLFQEKQRTTGKFNENESPTECGSFPV